MKVLHPSTVLGLGTGVIIVGVLAFLPRVFEEEPPVRRGTVAVGVAADGTLLVRSTLCSGDPVPVSVSHGTANGSGVREVATTQAGRQAPVELPVGLDERTDLTITAPDLDGLVVTAAGWRGLDEHVWMVASAPESRETTTLEGAELRGWSC
ncbi:hypothetical protein AFL01nite_13260 [Aeromicrobium flavum]|uniref:Uncharacterized protein n=1 Tax=Aeromicrobium flavum TaxID=416568 RepID=A0A512HU72_9ACTN|nr:hypothetical protein [Aeromicrobium flavum]GEO88999.1 hypothetical protein AFL01nite_13260 [Aeromicrobium flavum]